MRLPVRRDPADLSILDQPLYLVRHGLRVTPYARRDDGWLCVVIDPDGDVVPASGLLTATDDDIATAIADDDGPLSSADLITIWVDTVIARCGLLRAGLATGLAEFADPVTLTVRVDRNAYLTGLGYRCCMHSYGGFRIALARLTNAGLLQIDQDDPDLCRLALHSA